MPSATEFQPLTLVAGTKKGWWCAIAGAVLAGAALRVYGLDFGLPDVYYPDEFRKMRVVRGMMARGSLDPEYALHPPLLLYAAWFFRWMMVILGVGPADERTGIVLAGRAVSAVAGSASILLVGLIGRRVFGVFAGALSALLFASFPLHVTCSRYFKEDALLLFFVLAALCVLLKALDEDRPRLFVAAAFLGGMALASKWTGILTLALFIPAPWLKSGRSNPDRKWMGHVVLAIGAFVIGFLLCCPFALLNPQEYLAGITAERNHALGGHRGWKIQTLRYFFGFYLAKGIIPGTHLLAVIAAFVGVFVCHKLRYARFLIVLACLFYFAAELTPSKPLPQPERYVLLCLPFVALFAAALIERATHALSFSIRCVAAALLLFFPLSRSIALASSIESDTRKAMKQWISAHVPRGAVIVTAGSSAALPQLAANRYHVLALREIVQNDKEHAIDKLRASGADFLLYGSSIHPRFDSIRPPRSAASDRFLSEAGLEFPITYSLDEPEYRYAFHNPKLVLFNLSAPKASGSAPQSEK